MTPGNTTPTCFSLINFWLSQGKELAPHVKPALDRLSLEHISGISLQQLESPMMQQFKKAKEEAPDALLFFRMGDFYELFGADAIIASEVCGLTLTSRDKSSENPVPMAGLPVVGYKSGLRKCVRAGFKIAVCDQIEDPKHTKGIVKREITRIATPAVPGDLDEEEQGAETYFGCYLACVIENKKEYVFSYVDVSTGEFWITSQLDESLLHQELSTIKPKEILVPQALVSKISSLVKKSSKEFESFSKGPTISPLENWVLTSKTNCKSLFCEFFEEHKINAFGLNAQESPQALEAVCAILHYLKTTQRSVLKNISIIKNYSLSQHLMIDDNTRRHLDFFSTSSGAKKGSLFWFLNQCITATGSRRLLHKLNYPEKDSQKITSCLKQVQELVHNTLLTAQIKEILKKTSDLDKIVSQAAQKNLELRGLFSLKHTLNALPFFGEILRGGDAPLLSDLFAQYDSIAKLKSLELLFNEALSDDHPASSLFLGKGTARVFRRGYAPELDEVIDLGTNFNHMLLQLEKQEKENSHISNLKIGYTGTFGYYFEISKGKLSQTPAHFIRKQTLTHCERFVTPQLKELEEKALLAQEKRMVLEKELFENLRLKILEYSYELGQSSQWIAQIDVKTTFAELANKHHWCFPEITLAPVTHLRESVHPLLAHFSSQSHEPFIANDIFLGIPESEEGHEAPLIHLITGPNMAGKSTLMRQVAISHVLCQIGSYVPAKYAKMGLVDRIFTRIGSADHWLQGQSTFMVEMLETAQMLRFATPHSLLLLDEVGRGTSTFDGLALAWSLLEYLHDKVRARTLFSTHYHELQQVTTQKKLLCPMQMEVLEQHVTTATGELKKEILFSRKYSKGSAGKSYGLHVAALAGIPEDIIMRAGEVLKGLEHGKGQKSPLQKTQTLF